MMIDDPEFFKEILSVFKGESECNTRTITSELPRLGLDLPVDERTEIKETIFRAAHSIKGAVRTIGLADIEPLSQSLEHLFSRLKHLDQPLPADTIAMFLKAVEYLGELISTVDSNGKISTDKSKLSMLLSNLNDKLVLKTAENWRSYEDQ